MDDRHQAWVEEGRAWHYSLLPPAPIYLRLWGIRHCRAFLVLFWAYLTFNPKRPNWPGIWYKRWISYAIRQGWC